MADALRNESAPCAAHVPRRVARNGESWARRYRQQRDCGGVSRYSVRRRIRSVAVDVAQHAIRVNAIAPDLADTPQTPAELMLRGRDPDLIRTWIPVGRFGRPDDYAAVVEFLASDDARFVTGQTIPVDGGTLAASGWYARADRKGWTNMPNEA